MTKLRESRLKASSKYIKTKTDEIRVRVPKGQREYIKAYAAQNGESVNSLINRLLSTEMEAQ